MIKRDFCTDIPDVIVLLWYPFVGGNFSCNDIIKQIIILVIFIILHILFTDFFIANLL